MLKTLLKFVMVVTALLGGVLPSGAIVANPEPVQVRQPDGTILTLTLHGDEFCNYVTTSDGYTVAYNSAEGRWEYGILDADGAVVPGGVAVGANKQVGPLHAKGVIPKKRAAIVPISDKMRAPWRLAGKKYDYSKFRGLVILVEFNDASFSRPDAHTIFDEMINKKGYDGYMSYASLPVKVSCTGSVHDYYSENSNGRFNPKFDVVGPVKVNYAQLSARQTSGAQALVKAALAAANAQVDYRNYDTDGDGTVDMVYFIFAGAGSNYTGNDTNLIWPHAGGVSSYSLDGVRFGRYACSTELAGAPSANRLDGIGTICHEFSHVLGLSDLYDVDYETNGQSTHPGSWSVMAQGCYLNRGKTPCGYSLFERYTLGFASPRVIDEPGNYNIAPLNQGNNPDGCILKSLDKHLFFTLENRVRTRWDQYLPGSGLLIHRVDSTNSLVWDKNKVNNDASHNYYELVRAAAKQSGSKVVDSDADPFPGSAKVTAVGNTTTTNLLSWSRIPAPFSIRNIAIDAADNATFTVVKEEAPVLVEDFSTARYIAGSASQMEGAFARWTLSGGMLLTADSECRYLRSAKGEYAVIAPFGRKVETLSLRIDNTANSNKVAFSVYMSKNPDVEGWTLLSSDEGETIASVYGTNVRYIKYNLGGVEGQYYKIVQQDGATGLRCRVEQVAFGVASDTDSEAISVVADSEVVGVQYFTVDGVEVQAPTRGVYLVVKKLADGRNRIEKQIFR